MKPIGNKRFAFYVLHFAFAAATGVVYGNAPVPAPAATIDPGRGYTFESRSDGLYVASVPGGFCIVVR